MHKFSHILLIMFGAGLMACSSHLVQKQTHTYSVDGTSVTDVEIDSLIAPYSRKMKAEMSVIIGKCEKDLLVERPNSGLGQWICDALIASTRDSSWKAELPVVSLLNTGGLRAPLLQGPIQVGAIYQIMPFDNRIVYLKLPIGRLPEIASYMRLKGGEPIGGMHIVKDSMFLNKPTTDYFWLITTDFLANGGDNMLFLKNPTSRIDTDLLLRDFIIEAVKKQENILFLTEERISW